MAGYLYIMSNPAFRYIKLGRCSDHPDIRRDTLSRPASIPFPFKLERAWIGENPAALECQAKEVLHRYWVSREFFDIPVDAAARILEKSIQMERFDFDLHLERITGIDYMPMDELKLLLA